MSKHSAAHDAEMMVNNINKGRMEGVLSWEYALFDSLDVPRVIISLIYDPDFDLWSRGVAICSPSDHPNVANGSRWSICYAMKALTLSKTLFPIENDNAINVLDDVQENNFEFHSSFNPRLTKLEQTVVAHILPTDIRLE